MVASNLNPKEEDGWLSLNDFSAKTHPALQKNKRLLYQGPKTMPTLSQNLSPKAFPKPSPRPTTKLPNVSPLASSKPKPMLSKPSPKNIPKQFPQPSLKMAPKPTLKPSPKPLPKLTVKPPKPSQAVFKAGDQSVLQTISKTDSTATHAISSLLQSRRSKCLPNHIQN